MLLAKINLISLKTKLIMLKKSLPNGIFVIKITVSYIAVEYLVLNNLCLNALRLIYKPTQKDDCYGIPSN